MVESNEDLLTVQEVAHQLRVNDSTVRRWIKNGVLDAITLPHRGALPHRRARLVYRVRQATLDALLAPATSSASQTVVCA